MCVCYVCVCEIKEENRERDKYKIKGKKFKKVKEMLILKGIWFKNMVLGWFE